MARFVFRYHTLLKQAAAEENLRQRDLAGLLRLQMVMHGQLRQMQQTISDAKRELGEKLVGSVDLDAVRGVARFSGDSTSRGRQIVQKLAGLDQQITQARAVLADAMRKRKSLELLRDKDRLAWEQRERRRETAELDEIAAQAFARRMLEGASR